LPTPTPTLSAPSPTPTTPEPTPSGPWKEYSDPDFGFTIEYPPNYLFEENNPSVHQGLLRLGRFFDEKFAGTYPEGQVDISVYVKDADSLNEWVTKHSSTSTAPDDPQIYYRDVSSLTPGTANERPAVTFDWNAAEIGPVHVVAFFSGTRVVALDWFGVPSIEPIFDRMLDSYKD
jgi:hypothetical protein